VFGLRVCDAKFPRLQRRGRRRQEQQEQRQEPDHAGPKNGRHLNPQQIEENENILPKAWQIAIFPCF
jgi:hypothetical protein